VFYHFALRVEQSKPKFLEWTKELVASFLLDARGTLGAINSDHYFTETKDRKRSRRAMSSLFINSRRRFMGSDSVFAVLVLSCEPGWFMIVAYAVL
jgi:hypothetical protein